MPDQKIRKAIVYFHDEQAGIIEETGTGYKFSYDENFIKQNIPISVSMPTTQQIYESKELFSFFQGLIPEGWYLEIASKKLKIDEKDSFGILLATCLETIGAVSIKEIK